MNAIFEFFGMMFWGVLALLKVALYGVGFAALFFCLYLFYIVLGGVAI